MKTHNPVAGVKRRVLIGSIVALPVIGAGGVAYAATQNSGTATPSPSATQPAVNSSQGADTPGANDTPDTPGARATSETPEPANASETDGPGGHQDANGVDVNHQFEGQE